MKFGIRIFFEYLSRKLKFHENLTKILGTSDEDYRTLVIISRSVLLRMKTASDKCLEKIETHIVCSKIFFFENLAFCEIM